MTSPSSGREGASFTERLAELRRRNPAASGGKREEGGSGTEEDGREGGGGGGAGASRPSGLGIAARVGAEFTAAVAVGVFIGLALDRAFASAPWFLLLFICLGFAAGVLNLVRYAQSLDKSP